MVKINRIKSQIDYNQVYQVYIDNHFVMDISNGELKNCNVSVGKHTIEVKSSEYRSETLTFDIGDDENLEFTIEPDYKDTWFSKLLHHTIYGKQGLKLTLSKDFYI